MTLLLATLLLAAPAQEKPDADALAKSIGIDRGFVMLVGPGAGDLPVDLARRTGLRIFVQTPDGAEARTLRERAEEAGLLGTRVYVDTGETSRLQLAEDIAGAVVVLGGDVERAELMRVVHPGGKVIAGGKVEVKPVPDGAGEWSHPYHGPDNNPLAEDTLARGPYRTRFLATPWYGPMPQVTVTSGGRIFKAFGHVSYKKREWPLLNRMICLNAYSGVVLWERALTAGFMLHRNTLIATPDTLYLGDETSCKRIDAATGKVRDEIVLGPDVADGPVWKWMALEDGVLYALLGEKELIDETLKGTRTQSGWPWNGMGKGYARKDYPWGFGKTLLALDAKTKKVLWSRRFDAKIDSRAICMSDGRLFVYSHLAFLEALDPGNGKTLWRSDDADLMAAIGEHDRAQTWKRGYSSQTYTKGSPKVLYFAGPQRRRLVAVSAETGSLLWQREGGNVQLVLRGGEVYAMGKTSESLKLEPTTGKVLATLPALRGNCTRATGTVDAIFARGDQHGGTLRMSVEDDAPRRLASMRPGCQDGVIAANGLLYWGPWMCDCNHSLVGIISLGPRADPAGTPRRIVEPESAKVAEFPEADGDWPTYRADNRRSASTLSKVPGKAAIAWTAKTTAGNVPTAPIAAGGSVFVGGSDGVLRALDGATGRLRWKAYTGGSMRYPPAVRSWRIFAGSGDGRVHAFEAATGRPLWRYRVAPVERRIPVYGDFISTWPVNSGVLVADGVVYAAAGIASHDGTHVVALDARTGEPRWTNDTSGTLFGAEGATAGVAVQGHLLLHDGKLFMAGGNVVSPAVYDIADGKCLNELKNEWQKAPRGSELFLVNGKIEVVDQQLYSPRAYIPSRYFRKVLAYAISADLEVRASDRGVVCSSPAERKTLWGRKDLPSPAALVTAPNAILVAGMGPDADLKPVPAVTALDPGTGKTAWRIDLPAPVTPWGMAVDREGRVIVTLTDGTLLALSAGP